MRTYHHGNLREALVEAAVALGREKGPDGVVLREVARRTEVSHNAAYRHFADRDDLLREVAVVGLGELAAAMSARMQHVRATDPATRAVRRLRELGRAYVTYALAEPGLFAVAFAAPFERSPLLAGPYELLNQALDECVDAGVINPGKRTGAEVGCWSAVHGFAMLHLDGPLRGSTKAQREATLDAMLDAIEAGLSAPSPVGQ